MQLKVYVVHRHNTFRVSGFEWAINAQIDDGRPFTLTTTEDRPTEEEVCRCEEIAYRSMQLYHEHIKIPMFNLNYEVRK